MMQTMTMACDHSDSDDINNDDSEGNDIPDICHFFSTQKCVNCKNQFCDKTAYIDKEKTKFPKKRV